MVEQKLEVQPMGGGENDENGVVGKEEQSMEVVGGDVASRGVNSTI